MKLQLCLLVLVLGVAYVQSARLKPDLMEDLPEEFPEEEKDETERDPYYPVPVVTTQPPTTARPRCDWPVGFCGYIYDDCPYGTESCKQAYTCLLSTNKCCCWKGYGRR